MRLTVLGGGGVYPGPGGACGGFLVEHDGFRLLLDPGYAVVPRLLEVVAAGDVDAVYVTHGHPDHCADLNPLLRARAMGGGDSPPLPVYAPDDALDAVLALDRPLRVEVRPIAPRFEVGPFAAETRSLPHSLPNLGIRLSAGGRVFAYTGDCGPGSGVVALARAADVLVAEATFVDEVPSGAARFLSSAREVGRQAREANVGRLLLTHLQPGTDRAESLDAARAGFDGEVGVAAPGVSC